MSRLSSQTCWCCEKLWSNSGCVRGPACSCCFKPMCHTCYKCPDHCKCEEKEVSVASFLDPPIARKKFPDFTRELFNDGDIVRLNFNCQVVFGDYSLSDGIYRVHKAQDGREGWDLEYLGKEGEIKFPISDL